MEILGYAAAVLIGVSLGLIGSGGSILTVPVLVYLMSVEPVTSTAYSLFIVGITSLIGSIFYMKKKLVSYSTAVVFAIPAFISVFLTRLYLLPAIPEIIFESGDIILTKQTFIMLFFAVLMVLASISMIRNTTEDLDDAKVRFNFYAIFAEGIIVGVLTGLVGAGGGFLIIPALVLLAKLPIKQAVGTSLLIIATKSLIGFLGDLEAHLAINWTLLFTFTGLAIIGIFIGSYLSKFVSSKKLKPAFGYFVLAMSIYIFIKELI